MTLVMPSHTMERGYAPWVRTRSKSRFSDAHDARVMETACAAWCTTRCPIPVASGGKLLGMVSGDPTTAIARFVPAQYLSTTNLYDDYDQAIQKNTVGLKQFNWHWSKHKGGGVAGNWYDTWSTYGRGQAGAYGGTARTAKQFGKTTVGSMFHGPDVSPSLKFLKRTTGFNSEPGNRLEVSFLYDRVLSYETCSMTNGNQTMTNALAAQRWIGTGERGLQIFPTCDAVHNATTADLSQVRYTNEQGTTLQQVAGLPIAKIVSIAAPTTSQPARMILQGATTTTTPASPFLELAAGDLGARLINDYSFTAAPTGTNCFALVWPYLMVVEMVYTGQSYDHELVSGVEALGAPRIYDDACLAVAVLQRSSIAGMLEGWVETGWQ